MQKAPTVTKRPFSPPFFSGKTEKKGPSETTGSCKFATTSQSAFGCQLPWKGSLFYSFCIK